jgi:hypothetical protein
MLGLTIFGVGAGSFAVVAGLMIVCGGAIGRLLWLLEGRPPLDRPSWWPGHESTRGTSPEVPLDAAANHSGPIAACVACCGAPVLVLAGVVSLGVATVVGALVGLTIGAALLLAAEHGIRRPPRGSRACCRTLDPAARHGGESHSDHQ